MTAVFHFDTNSPYAWLAAERVDDVLGSGVIWQPIAFGFLLRAQRRRPWSFDEPARSRGVAECEARARARGLPPMRWPEGWPVGSYALEPLRAVVAAADHGREREVALALFRRNFVTGEGVRDTTVVRACWAQAGLDPDAYDAGIAAAKPRLVAATEAAVAEGVPGVPAVTVDGRHHWGDDRLEEAAAALRASAAAP